MRRERIEEYAHDELDAARIRYGGTWLGRELWIPVWDEPPCIGPPVFILVRNESIRLTDPDEGFAILDRLMEAGEGPIRNRSRTGPDRSQTLYPSHPGLTP